MIKADIGIEEVKLRYINALLDINEAAEVSERPSMTRWIFVTNGELRLIALKMALALSKDDIEEKTAVVDELGFIVDYTASFASDSEKRQETWQAYVDGLIRFSDLKNWCIAVDLLNYVYEQVGMDLALSLAETSRSDLSGHKN